MKKRTSKDDGLEIDTSLWMVTFGDLLMLLLTFFVLLLSMSSMDTKALKNMFSIFRGAVGALEFSDTEGVKPARDILHEGAGGSLELPGLHELSVLRDRYLRAVKEKKAMNSNGLQVLKDILIPESDFEQDDVVKNLKNVVDISQDERGVILTLQDMVLFDSGKAEIKPTAYPLLDWLAEVLYSIPNDVLIMGHTDNVPMRSARYRSNWELSLYRALSVHSYLVENKGLSPERFGVGGYGDLRPLVPNNIRGGQEKNRRVEVIVKRTQAS